MLLTQAELEYPLDVAEGRYRMSVQTAHSEQPNLLTELARITVAMELLAEAWEHEKAKARAAMM